MTRTRGAHLIFFDGECALCNASVRVILRLDRKRRFLFAPLNGPTAKEMLTGKRAYLRRENSMVLIENYLFPGQRLWIRGRAAFRILWLIGGLWKLIGWLCFIPFGVDLAYRLVARHRYLLSSEKNTHPLPNDNRFLK